MSQNNDFLNIGASIDNLAAVTEYISNRAETLLVPIMLLPKLELVIEELFLNIVNHANPKSRKDVEIGCTRQKTEKAPGGEMLCISTRDWGPEFNPLQKEKPLLEEDIEKRAIGGLGVYLVTEMADHCSYVRQDGSNLFTVCFKL